MWFQTEVIFPRLVKSFFWTLVVQECYIAFLLLLIKIISWNPITGIIDWIFYLVHWKTIFYQILLCVTTLGFGALNIRYYSVQKNISSTRLQKIFHALNPSHIQHFLVTTVLGGVVSLCCIGLFHTTNHEKISRLEHFLHLENGFEHFFVLLHGCYTGIMFSLKYFICCLYLLKFTLEQKTKISFLKSQFSELVKDSVACILKGVFWYYLIFVIVGPILQNVLFKFSGQHLNANDSTLYSMLSPKLFVMTVISGVVIFLNWSLYMLIFNACMVERYEFSIDTPAKKENNKCLSIALLTPQYEILKYLAVLDLRLLAQYDIKRRQQLFAISHPGGHPYQWNSISEVCVSSLQDLLEKLHTYAVTVNAQKFKIEAPVVLPRNTKQEDIQKLPSSTKKVIYFLQSWPAVSYFIDELPNAKIRQIFSTSQPLIWMVEALGFLLSASYVEDKFGVVQQMLPQIVTLLLDLKMAEEKLPIDPIGIKTHVKDPQDRYEHIHQRLALKTAVNTSLCRIATAFKEDVSGIYLPDEYNRYFQRFINRKNT